MGVRVIVFVVILSAILLAFAGIFVGLSHLLFRERDKMTRLELEQELRE